MHKGLNHFLTRHHFFNKAVLNPQVLLLGAEVTTWLARDILDDKDHDKNNDKNNQEQERTNRQHGNRYPKDGNRWG